MSRKLADHCSSVHATASLKQSNGDFAFGVVSEANPPPPTGTSDVIGRLCLAGYLPRAQGALKAQRQHGNLKTQEHKPGHEGADRPAMRATPLLQSKHQTSA